MRLTHTCIDNTNLIEKVPVTGDHPPSPDWDGPFYLFLREGQGDRFVDVLVAGPCTEDESREIKRRLHEDGRVRHWSEWQRKYV